MTRYRKVDVRMYGDHRFHELSAPAANAQTLWTYLLTCGHDRSIPGVLVVGVGQLADELGWSGDDVRRCLAEIDAAGMAEMDLRKRVIWLPNRIRKGDAPRAPANVTAWGRQWTEVPECSLKAAGVPAAADYCAERGEAFLEALEGACGKAAPSVGPKPEAKLNLSPELPIPIPIPNTKGVHTARARDPDQPEPGAEWAEPVDPPVAVSDYVEICGPAGWNDPGCSVESPPRALLDNIRRATDSLRSSWGVETTTRTQWRAALRRAIGNAALADGTRGIEWFLAKDRLRQLLTGAYDVRARRDGRAANDPDRAAREQQGREGVRYLEQLAAGGEP